MTIKMYNVGLVIGKFYPPHLGHKFLIDTAAQNCKELYVLVCDDKRQLIPANKRAEWLQKIHPDANVKVIHDIGYDDDSETWAKHTINFFGFAPDVVFSSEDYGITYSKYMGCAHVMVDKERTTVNISATKVRNNMTENWNYLHPVVQDFFIPRVVILGAESTGTTTLAKDLANFYQTAWVPEFGRIYSESIPNVWTYSWKESDFEFIAQMQNNLEKSLVKTANKVLICDTDSYTTTFWEERYLGKISDAVKSIESNNDLYILTGDEIPFVQDGIRDGEEIRHKMHERFVEGLTADGKNWILLTGSKSERLQKAVAEIDKLIQKKRL